MNIDKVWNKYKETIEAQMEFIKANKNIIKTPIPPDYSYVCEEEMIFGLIYGYLPEVDDPILCSRAFEEIATDPELGRPCSRV